MLRTPVRALRVAAALPRSPRTRHRVAAWAAAWKTRLTLAPRRLVTRRRWVVISLAEHMGDIVAAEPIARHVRGRFPDAVIFWAVNRPYAALVASHPAIDRILPLRCLSQWIHLRQSRLFDTVIDLQIHGRFCARCDQPLERPENEREIHVGNYYAHGPLLTIFCQCAGLPHLDESPRLHLSNQAVARVDQLPLPEAFIAIHCRSNQDVRDWTDEKWRELVARLIAEGFKVVEIGLAPAAACDDPAYIDLCGRLSIVETAEVIRRAEAFIGIDSGPAHLAHAAGTPGVILLGQYRHYERYMPYSGDYGSGRNAVVIQNDGPAADITVDRAFKATLRMLGALNAEDAAAVEDGR